MKIITRDDRAKLAPMEWYRQYQMHATPEQKRKTDILLALVNPKYSEIDSIIGNDSWTILRCNECERTSDWVIQLGQEPDYESSTARICAECFDKAKKLVNGTKLPLRPPSK